jgi:hypothetical protein
MSSEIAHKKGCNPRLYSAWSFGAAYNKRCQSSEEYVDMSAQSLYNSFTDHLEVSTRVSQQSGAEIQVGEEFTLRITVRNNAPSAAATRPRIHFKDTRVAVVGTQFARPVDGNSVNLRLADTSLVPGEARSVDVRMRATQALFNSTIPGLFPEEVARITVSADVDQDAFFNVRKRVTGQADIVVD